MRMTWRPAHQEVSAMKSLRRFVTLAVLALGIGTSGLLLDARQWTSTPGETAPAGKAGWWVRVNPQNQASHVFLRFGIERSQLGGPIGWIQGTSPDIPEVNRTGDRLHVAAIAIPPSVPVSLCLFYADRGVALVEFTQETTLDVEQGQSAEQCVP
jgi:hypothetical protein